MTAFALAALTLALAVLIPFAWWLRRNRNPEPDAGSARLTVLRDRRAELDAELADGRLDEAAHAQACRELEDLALEELAPVANTAAVSWSRQTMLGIAVAVPLVAGALYFSIGGHDALRTSAPADSPTDLATLVDELEARMQSTPDELQGWMLLGRSSVVLGQYPRAIAAWRQASRLAPDDSTVLANLAEALILSDDRTLGGEAGIMLEQALRADATNPKALWYGGLAADRRGESELARERWTALLAQDPPQPFRDLIERRLGITFELAVSVDGLEQDTGFVFVTLHEPDSEGPPLAATRVAWPAERLRIGSGDVMQPGTRLADYPRFRVVVRWSADADAARSRGDRWGEVLWTRGEPQSLRINLPNEVE